MKSLIKNLHSFVKNSTNVLGVCTVVVAICTAITTIIVCRTYYAQQQSYRPYLTITNLNYKNNKISLNVKNVGENPASDVMTSLYYLEANISNSNNPNKYLLESVDSANDFLKDVNVQLAAEFNKKIKPAHYLFVRINYSDRILNKKYCQNYYFITGKNSIVCSSIIEKNKMDKVIEKKVKL